MMALSCITLFEMLYGYRCLLGRKRSILHVLLDREEIVYAYSGEALVSSCLDFTWLCARPAFVQRSWPFHGFCWCQALFSRQICTCSFASLFCIAGDVLSPVDVDMCKAFVEDIGFPQRSEYLSLARLGSPSLQCILFKCMSWQRNYLHAQCGATTSLKTIIGKLSLIKFPQIRKIGIQNDMPSCILKQRVTNVTM